MNEFPPSRFDSCRLRRLRIEPLEDRRMLATYVVDSLLDNTDDDGQTTLREALVAANENPDADRIEFASTLFDSGPQTIALQIVEEDTSSHGKSAFVISENVELVGPGDDLLTIDASTLDLTPEENDEQGARVFHITEGTESFIDVSISGLRLTGGDPDEAGGAIRSTENLTLTDVTLTWNHAGGRFQGRGGALYQLRGQLQLFQVVATENIASSGGALYASQAELTISESVFSSNHAEFGGGGIYATDGTHTISNSQITLNTVENYAGGIYVERSQTSLFGVEVSHNTGENVTGGGIYLIRGSLVVADSDIASNTAGGNPNTQDSGGGIAVFDASLELLRTRIHDNSATGDGGGIDFDDSASGKSLRIIESEITDNDSGGEGGGSYLDIASTTAFEFRGNLVSGNQAENDGGGIYLAKETGQTFAFEASSFTNNRGENGGGLSLKLTDEASVDVIDSVFSGNRADGSGGGLFASTVYGSVEVIRTTVANNRADADSSGSGIGHGVFLQQGELHLGGTIVGANSTVANVAPDIGLFPGASLTAEFSLIGSNVGNGLIEAPVGTPDFNGNLIGGTGAAVIDPRIGPLGTFGGVLPVHPLQPRSPAIDAGDPSAVASVGGVPEFDLRGMPFTRVFDGGGNAGARIDMGSFEISDPTLSSPLIVDTLVDEFDGDFSTGDLSLREAVIIANTSLSSFEIQFAPHLSGGKITLTIGELPIVRDMEIIGLGAEQLTIDGNAPSSIFPTRFITENRRIFRIDDGDPNTQSDVHLSGLTLLNAEGVNGGAIYSQENLTLTGISATGNRAGSGAAVYSENGALTASQSLFNANEGGAIFASSSDILLLDVEVSGNVLRGQGGAGIAVQNGALSVVDSTVSENTLEPFFSFTGFNNNSEGGAGIRAESTSIEITGSTFFNNTIDNASSFGRNTRGGAVYLSQPLFAFGVPDNTLTVSNSSFHGNTAGESPFGLAGVGGGIATDAVLSAVFDGVDFEGNLAAAGGGAYLLADAIEIENSSFVANRVGDSGKGGGAFARTHSLSVLDSQFDENTRDMSRDEGVGGGLYYLTPSTFSVEPNGNNVFIEIARSTFNENLAYAGGGLFIDTRDARDVVDINVRDSQFIGNQISVSSFDRSNGGGGIGVVSGSRMFDSTHSQMVSITDSEITGNSSTSDSSGAGIFVYTDFETDVTPELILHDTTIASNQTSGRGGGLYAKHWGFDGRGSQFIENLADMGGGIWIERDVFSSIHFPRLEDLTINKNTATRYGGGVFSDSTAIFERVNISENSASEGGGVYSLSGATVLNSTLAHNEATDGSGGAIHAVSMLLVQSTLSNNSATSDGGAVRLTSVFGQIANSTIVENHAGNIAGAISAQGTGQFPVSNTILAGNTAGPLSSASDADTHSAYDHSFIGHNSSVPGLLETGLTTSDANGNYVGGDVGGAIDPLLEPLRHNGGPTPTRQPRADSPVLDAGDLAFNPNDPDSDPSTDDALLFDQRGTPYGRVVDGNAPTDVVIDIGAVEWQAQSADFDGDENVDGFDFLTWQIGFETPNATTADGDADNDGDVDAADLDAWQSGYGVTPYSPPQTNANADLPEEHSPTDFSLSELASRVALESALESMGSQTEFVEERQVIDAVFSHYAAKDERVSSQKRMAVANRSVTAEPRTAPNSEIVDELIKQVFD